MSRNVRVMKAAGAVGFAFFFVKGLVWLAVLGGAAVTAIGR